MKFRMWVHIVIFLSLLPTCFSQAGVLTAVTGLIKAAELACKAFHWGCEKTVIKIVNNNPPKIDCLPDIIYKIAPLKSLKAVVTWPVPLANDHEDGAVPVHTSDPSPGSAFAEGIHAIRYWAKDSKGVKSECAVIISIKVVRCSEPPNILHGKKQCSTTQKQTVLGDRCSFTCGSGYNLQGESAVTCDKTGSFLPHNPTCQPVKCSALPPVQNGMYNCASPAQHYEDTCFLNCSSGYRVGTGKPYTTCKADKTWSTSAPCIDDTPPIFDICPLNVTTFSDRGSNATNVTWSEVKASDPPSGRPARVVLVSSKAWGTYFEEGEHQVEYHAYDAAGNRAITPCSFKVTVETIRCPTPELHPGNKPLMVYGCTDYIYGRVCPVSCQSGYPLGGPDHIVCERDNSFPPVARWTWNQTSGIKPYCMERPCSNLTAPSNGALACDKWMHGRMCQMQCNQHFNFPVSAPSDGMFVCGRARGKWLPTDLVPDCVAYAGFSTMRMKSYFYYNGSCPTLSAQLQIKGNFIQALTASFYGFESCTNVTACKADNVQVICGKVTRGIQTPLTQGTVTVKFDVVIDYDTGKGSGPAVLGLNDQRLHKVAAKLQKVAQSGSFGLEKFGLKLEKATVEPQSASLDCPEGRMADMSKGSCVGCTKGSYLDQKTRTCVDCPVGSYQQHDSAPACTQCPSGTSTAVTGSWKKADCREICPQGFVSPDGLAPCSPCPMGSYIEHTGNENCLHCPNGQITRASASTSYEECVDFDISLGINSVAVFKPTHTALSRLTFATWLYLYDDVQETFNLATWQDPRTQHTSLALVHRDTIEVISGGSSVKTSVRLPALQWTHVAMQLDGQSGQLSLFVDGHLRDSQTISVASGQLVKNGHSLTIRSSNNAAGVLSHLVVFDHVVPTTTISKLSSSCVTTDSAALQDMTDMDKDLSDGVHYVIPSVCGEILS